MTIPRYHRHAVNVSRIRPIMFQAECAFCNRTIWLEKCLMWREDWRWYSARIYGCLTCYPDPWPTAEELFEVDAMLTYYGTEEGQRRIKRLKR